MTQSAPEHKSPEQEAINRYAKNVRVTARRVQDAIQRLVEYNYTDEYDDFLNNPPDSGRVEDHILSALLVLEKYLHG